MNTRIALSLCVVVSAGLFACGGGDSGTKTNVETEEEMGVAGAPASPSGDEPLPLNGCKADSFVDLSAEADERVVQIGVDGLLYTPRCILIAVGQTVTFDGSLSAHPLAPGNADDPGAGSPNNPITFLSSGSSAEFTFDEPGTFPYFCELHGFSNGKGMSGAIYVRAAE